METIDSIEERLNKVLSRNSKRKPTVVVYGLMNTGKSYLLNMLTNNIESEFFKTNDIRETAELKKFESDSYIYIDTPGLDANVGDDKLAYLGADEADIVLFVHQPQGELEDKEIKVLEAIGKSFGNYAEDNIVIVITKIEKESQDKIDAIESKIKYQCLTMLGFSPEIIQISNIRYHKGAINSQDKLIKLSNINILSQHMQSISIEGVRAQRIKCDLDEIYEDANRHETSLKSTKNEMQVEIRSQFSVFIEGVKSLKEFIKKSNNVFEKL